MVTQQILVLSFWVRIPAAQHDGNPSEERKEPAAQYASDKPDDQVDEESRTSSLDDQVGDPSGGQSDQQIP